MLSTKDVSSDSEGGMPKTIAPGNLKLKVNNVELKQFPFMVNDKAYYLILNVETEPIEGFEGFFFDKDDESAGRHAGQVGAIKTNRFYYKDGETKGGTKINRDQEIMKMVKNLCEWLGCMDWFLKVDNKYSTVEDLVAGLNEAAPFKDTYADFCVAGKEYYRNNGYLGFDLFIPKPSRTNAPIALPKADKPVVVYSESEHLTKAAPKEVSNFDGGDDLDAPSPGGNLGTTPEFEL